MHIRLSADAEADLEALAGWLQPRSPQGLDRLLTARFTTLTQLEGFPLLGKQGRVEGTRELVVPRTSLIVIYTLPDAYHLDVEPIFDGRQKYPPDAEGPTE
ncbi:MAG: type II toxin-antitoxin system RelE/ParE family toxin [Hyphomonas sp.]|uniref:type II toxin-antitoxin system RelE/ParE family toxin n=1 Tax=Hyphomonas sp. TaxID=87 RepID=UPI0017E49B49|nr:type II toxin-antitoxin system RelE/ParE family toxin [Hyphomonas sp.]MBU3920035.1 type II toxin-antitoxin system RelE/ParE family toxin [Alphaproteobacteria bacterium]MBA3069455.1 type II toxin-antitoxin system RelE/ParE family toxin [Hyphomonas sp.]MBU4063837.1 type II toxin-antitoxin system RelE/ParE family toxin [Alphaproteobacteria bacterium]MBU4164202.1 type II toxin-antitoxin system RelE/ParE family toxin [Alphaproteobacteria bacterium]MBU4567361.1 type II toxin-antitoxin system RelE